MVRPNIYGFQSYTSFMVLMVCMGVALAGKLDVQTQREKRFLNKLQGDSTLKKVGIAKPKPGGGLGGFGYLVFGNPKPGPTTPAPKENNNADEPINVGNVFTKDDKTCFDLAIALDISCSVSLESKNNAQIIIKSILSEFPPSADKGVRINLVTFAEDVIQTIYFDPAKTIEELHSAVDELELIPSVCKTNTWQAIKEVSASFYSDDLNDADVISHGPKILIIIGDGRGSPRSKEKLTEIYTDDLKQNNVTMIWIETELDSDKRKSRDETEIDVVMSDEAILHMDEDSDIADKLIQYLKNVSQCDSKQPRIKPDFNPT